MRPKTLSALSDPVLRLRVALTALPGLVIIGTVGYTILGMAPFDAFYMTLITISTVGYGEVGGDLDLPGRMFTTLLIIMGIFLVAFSSASFFESIVEGELARHFGRRRLERKIGRLKGHWIIAGFGRMGQLVEREIRKTPGAPEIVVIDCRHESVRKCEEEGIYYLEADATTEEALEEAGIARAQGLVSLVASDADNVYICLTARELRPDLTIVARCLEERSEAKLRRAGANKVVSPYQVGGQRLSMAILSPAVGQFLDFAHQRDLFEMGQAEVRKGSRLIGRQLKDSGLRDALDIILLAIKRTSGEMMFNPNATSVLQEGDTLIALGGGEAVARFDSWVNRA